MHERVREEDAHHVAERADPQRRDDVPRGTERGTERHDRRERHVEDAQPARERRGECHGLRLEAEQAGQGVGAEGPTQRQQRRDDQAEPE